MASLPFDDANMPLFTVGQVAEMLEVQQAFLRRLDEFRVVRPSRSAGGQRRYTRNEIVVVRYVVELMDDGLTLSAIRRVLQLEARVRELEAERDALRAALAQAEVRREASAAVTVARPRLVGRQRLLVGSGERGHGRVGVVARATHEYLRADGVQRGEHVAELVIARQLEYDVARQLGLGPGAGRQPDGADLLARQHLVQPCPAPRIVGEVDPDPPHGHALALQV